MKTLEMRENRGKHEWGCTYKTTHISIAIYHKLQNCVPNQSQCNVLCYLMC